MPTQRFIQAVGSYLPQDAEGYILNDTSWQKIPKPWHIVLHQIIESYDLELGNELHSVYLRGSLARGTQVDGFSDVDTFALVHRPNLRWVEASWQAALQAKLQKRHPFVKEVEIMLSSFDEDIVDSYPGLAMQIKTQSLCLHGPDCGQYLAAYKPSKNMMIYYRWLEMDLKSFSAKEKITKEDCRVLMKRIVRAGFELVMVKEGRFTSDLYFCYQAFGKYYPEYEENMKEVLYFYLNPIANKKRLIMKIHSFGNWLVAQINKELLA